ncbi:hypothetical protein CLOM_g7193 [Closterium sp. NIES-68]|nr:hypothetical protein CLOM_g7193 [Closterium sp. NIES-68]
MAIRFSPEELKGELLRVRRELAHLDTLLDRTFRDIEAASEHGERDRMDDARNVRQCLWKDKEQLRSQETIFLKLLFDPNSVGGNPGENGAPTGGTPFPPQFSVDGSPMPMMGHGDPSRMLHSVFTPPSMLGVKPGKLKMRRNKLASPGLPTSMSDGKSPSGFESDFANPSGYEVNRSAECKVRDVWLEWKEGLNGFPSIEKLEEERKKDRKKVWWKNMNDYKYWSKQMRIVHAVEEKARELGGDLDASINFWEDILREEFDGSVSKLREALGGQKTNEEDIGRFKKRCRDLLQKGLLRMAKKRQMSHQPSDQHHAHQQQVLHQQQMMEMQQQTFTQAVQSDMVHMGAMAMPHDPNALAKHEGQHEASQQQVLEDSMLHEAAAAAAAAAAAQGQLDNGVLLLQGTHELQQMPGGSQAVMQAHGDEQLEDAQEQLQQQQQQQQEQMQQQMHENGLIAASMHAAAQAGHPEEEEHGAGEEDQHAEDEEHMHEDHHGVVEEGDEELEGEGRGEDGEGEEEHVQ